MDRMESTAKVLSKVLSIIRIVLIVACALAFVAALAMIIWANPLISAAQAIAGTTTVNMGSMHVTIESATMTAGNLRLLMLVTFIAVAVLTALFFIAIVFLKRLLDDIGQGHPFAPQAPGLIRRLAIVVFVGSVAVPLVSSLTEMFTYRFLGIQGIAETTSTGNPVAINSGFSLSIDLTAVVVGFIVLLLAYVFEYGVQLQAQADETL